MTHAMINIDALHKEFKGEVALRNINTQVNKGDVIALLGENGAGKSTLLESILGFTYPSSGRITLFGQCRPVELSDELKHRIGYVPQTEELLPNMTADAYLSMIASFYLHWNTHLIEQRLEEWKLPRNKRLSSLSGGQRQMVSILSAIGHEPELLILDEPVASLDPASRRRFLQLLIDSQLKNNTTILFSTHIVSDVERIATRLWLLKQGELSIDEGLDTVKERTGQSLEDLFLERHSL